ncbi:SDR family NAD(P)-dependent oxidoreductase [Flavobacteriaceae bacterium F08102]|nr:SDR family NAD(P)-dependent oxidoreductase [Flavobacteriaceae bacterium F08102]
MNFSKLAGKNVLITGATGFIGSNLTLKLMEFDVNIYGVSRAAQDATKNIHWFQGDLADENFVNEIFTTVSFDYVIHLASHVLGARDQKYVSTTFKSNLVTTVNLLNAVHNHKVTRLVLAGSFEEGEQNKSVPSSPYAAAKIGASNYAKMFYHLYNTPVVTASLYMVYGPGQVDVTKLIPYTILTSLKGESPVFSSGVRMIDWVFVDDVVEGLMRMLLVEDIEGKTIDLGSGKSISIKEIVNLTLELVDQGVKPNFSPEKDRPMEQEKNADVNSSYTTIGWKPKTSLKKGLQATIAYYRNYCG